MFIKKWIWQVCSTSLNIIFQAMSDWCMDPNPFLEEQLGKLVSDKVPAYYLGCDPTQPSPFTRYLTRAQKAADVVLTSLNKVTRIADANYEPKLVSCVE